MIQIESFLTLLNLREDKTLRAFILQSYIQTCGPVPDEYADDVDVKKLLRGEVE